MWKIETFVAAFGRRRRNVRNKLRFGTLKHDDTIGAKFWIDLVLKQFHEKLKTTSTALFSNIPNRLGNIGDQSLVQNNSNFLRHCLLKLILKIKYRLEESSKTTILSSLVLRLYSNVVIILV